MRLKEFNQEVFFVDEQIAKISRGDIEALKKKALSNRRKRVRVCSHKNTEDKLHEMLIIHTKGAYLRPHKHLGKSESMCVLEGSADVIFYDQAGNITDTMEVGDYTSGRSFYYRISDARYHNLVIKSDFFVFHEVTSGPFIIEDTIYAPWSKEEAI